MEKEGKRDEDQVEHSDRNEEWDESDNVNE